MGYIYRIINVKNGKFYIGSTINIKRRKTIHFSKLRTQKHHNKYLQSAWNKDGEESFSFEILEECNGEYSDLLDLEQQWLDTTKAYECGYNLSEKVGQPPLNYGVKKPNSGRKMCGELLSPTNVLVKFIGIRKFCRENGLEVGPVCSLLKGKKGYYRGWKTTVSGVNTVPCEYHKMSKSEKISKALKGRKLPKEQIKNLSKKLMGRPRPQWVREKISKSHIGKKLSEETKKKISEGKKRFHEQSLAVVNTIEEVHSSTAVAGRD